MDRSAAAGRTSIDAGRWLVRTRSGRRERSLAVALAPFAWAVLAFGALPASAAPVQVPGPTPTSAPSVTTVPGPATTVPVVPTAPRYVPQPTSPAPMGAIGYSPVPATTPIRPQAGGSFPTVPGGLPAGILPDPGDPAQRPVAVNPLAGVDSANPYDLPTGRLPGLGPVVLPAILLWFAAAFMVFFAVLREISEERARAAREAEHMPTSSWSGRSPEEIARALRELMADAATKRDALAHT